MLPATSERVRRSTAPAVNRRIDHKTDLRVQYFSEHPGEIDCRLAQLDREWDIERTLEAHAAAITLAGVALGKFVNPKFYAVPAFVGSFLLMHAVQGWCPPVPIFRRLGVRSEKEIQQERQRLQDLRARAELRPLEAPGAAPKAAQAEPQLAY